MNETESKLLKEAEEILQRSALGKADAEFNYNLILQWVNKYPIETMTPQEAEKAMKEGDQLLGRLRISIQVLKRLDEAYEELRGRVNKHYGKEVMPKQERIDYDALFNCGNDEGDEWKTIE